MKAVHNRHWLELRDLEYGIPRRVLVRKQITSNISICVATIYYHGTASGYGAELEKRFITGLRSVTNKHKQGTRGVNRRAQEQAAHRLHSHSKLDHRHVHLTH